MITLCAIASGSNGNCYYIGNGQEAILIDAGISARQIMVRMHQQQLDPRQLKAIFISHEHTDHTSGARVLGKRLQVPVYLTSRTFLALYARFRPISPRWFVPGEEIAVGTFTIYPFLKQHDAAEPCSFRIACKGFQIGVFTDLGMPCERVRHHLGQCHAVFLETNYDEKMLWEGRYPWPLKRRIASENGHLSNDQAFELLKDHSGSQLQTVFLSHLSAENNTREKALERFVTLRETMDIRLTSRYAPGEVVRIGM